MKKIQLPALFAQATLLVDRKREYISKDFNLKGLTGTQTQSIRAYKLYANLKNLIYEEIKFHMNFKARLEKELIILAPLTLEKLLLVAYHPVVILHRVGIPSLASYICCYRLGFQPQSRTSQKNKKNNRVEIQIEDISFKRKKESQIEKTSSRMSYLADSAPRMCFRSRQRE